MDNQNPITLEQVEAILNADDFSLVDENHQTDNFLPHFDPMLDSDPMEYNRILHDHPQQDAPLPSNPDGFFPSSGFGNPIPIAAWPVTPSPYSCSCCQTLREIAHVNGAHVMKLEVHGSLGVISHAVLQKFFVYGHRNIELHMFDFCNETIWKVKQFLIEYCEDRKQEGCTMLPDPLSSFFDAICIGIDSDFSLDLDDGSHNLQDSTEDNQPEQKQLKKQEGYPVRFSTSKIAMQRERTGKMKLKDLSEYFHLPMWVAAKEMKICQSAIKGICRKAGLKRWPHRKIRSIQRKIAKTTEQLGSGNADERSSASTQLQDLQRKLSNIYHTYTEN